VLSLIKTYVLLFILFHDTGKWIDLDIFSTLLLPEYECFFGGSLTYALCRCSGTICAVADAP